jgi:hypothetical protein
MDFAHETKKKKNFVTEEQVKKTQETAMHGYPYESLWDLMRQASSTHPLLHRREYK